MKTIFGFLISIQIALGSGEGASAGTQDKLAYVLGGKFDLTVTDQGDSIRFEGDASKVAQLYAAFHNFDTLRTHFLPPTRQTTQCVSKAFESWLDCFPALGINQDSVRMIDISKASDKDGELLFASDSEFNRGVAELYLKTIKGNSPLFAWACANIKELVTTDDTGIKINYKLLEDFLCPSTVAFQADQDSIVLPKQWLLKHIIAANSGMISLQRTAVDGEYRLCIASLGETGPIDSEIVVMIDVSGSMSGQGINDVNRYVPMLLEKLKETCDQKLPAGSRVTFVVQPFDSKLYPPTTFTYMVGSKTALSPWTRLIDAGGTNLTYIGEALRTITPSAHKSVIAFTDGGHNEGGNMNDHIVQMRALHQRGNFAFPFLCPVGNVTDSYFRNMNDIFGGCYTPATTVQAFCEAAGARAVEVIEPKLAFLLELLNKAPVTFWHRQVGGFTQTDKTVKAGDAVSHGGHKQTIEAPVTVSAAIQHRDPAAGMDDAGGQPVSEVAALRAENAALAAKVDSVEKTSQDAIAALTARLEAQQAETARCDAEAQQKHAALEERLATQAQEALERHNALMGQMAAIQQLLAAQTANKTTTA